MTATSVASSLPSSLAVRVVPSWKVTVIEDAPSTTWAAVAMLPSLSTTKPVPVAVPCCGCCGPPNGLWLASPSVTPRDVMSTTPGEAAAYRDFGSRPVLEPFETVRVVAGRTIVVVLLDPPPSSASTRPPESRPPASALAVSRAASRGGRGPPLGPEPPGGGSRRGGTGSGSGPWTGVGSKREVDMPRASTPLQRASSTDPQRFLRVAAAGPQPGDAGGVERGGAHLAAAGGRAHARDVGAGRAHGGQLPPAPRTPPREHQPRGGRVRRPPRPPPRGEPPQKAPAR